MSKKNIKGKKGKGGRTQTTPTSFTRAYLPQEGQLFAIVVRLLGGNHIEVRCEDDKMRTARIPGKIRRRMWVRVGDLVIIEPWYGLQDDTKADLKYRYRKTEYRALSKVNKCRGALEKLEVVIPREDSSYVIQK